MQLMVCWPGMRQRLACVLTIGNSLGCLRTSQGPTIYTEGDFCAPNSTLDTCFFERMSGCSLEDAGFTLDEWERIPEYDSQYIQDGDKCAADPISRPLQTSL